MSVRFLEWRIRRLQAKVDVQSAHVAALERAAKAYQTNHYMDRFLEAHRKWLELNSELKWLKEKKK